MTCQDHEPRIFTPLATAARTRSTSKETQRNARQPPHAQASSTEDHAAQNPRSRDRAAGQKDQPEPPGEKRKMRKTGGSPMPPAVKNSRTVTPFRPVPPTEKQVNTLASTPRATHIRTVPKRPSTNRTVFSCSMMSQPVTPRGNAGRKKANFSNPGRFRTKAAAALQTNEREPLILTPPGTAATPAIQTVVSRTSRPDMSPVLVLRPGWRRKPGHNRDQTDGEERARHPTEETDQTTTNARASSNGGRATLYPRNTTMSSGGDEHDSGHPSGRGARL